MHLVPHFESHDGHHEILNRAQALKVPGDEAPDREFIEKCRVFIQCGDETNRRELQLGAIRYTSRASI